VLKRQDDENVIPFPQKKKTIKQVNEELLQEHEEKKRIRKQELETLKKNLTKRDEE
jgi:hypothetical protein